MFRYFAYLWNPTKPAQAAAAQRMCARLPQLSPQYQSVLHIDGLHVVCAGEQPSLRCRRLLDNAGVVLGSLFERSRDLADDSLLTHVRLDEHATRSVVHSQGQRLIDDYWGNYVAFVSDTCGVSVIVSPSSSLPCLSSTVEGITWVYSCLTDAIALGLPSLTRSHTYLRDRALGRLIDGDNPLHEVSRLLRGEALRFRLAAHRTSIERQLLWHPHRIVETQEPFEDPIQAARAMRGVVRACTRTLAADHGSVQLRLSGGLDSSIVAACLRGTGRPVTCHTYFDSKTTADPRPWARLAASHSGYGLTEHSIETTSLHLPKLAQLRPSPDVMPLLEYLFRADLERTLCLENAATAVFTGDGGDSGFCSDTVARALVEYLKRHGLRPRVWSLAHQVALATDRSTWQVLRRSVRRWRGSAQPDDRDGASEPHQLVALDVLHQTKLPSRHPWFRGYEPMPVVTQYRLGALPMPPQGCDLSIDPPAVAPDLIHPLYAQPVVELLLRIPLYIHFEDGRDRGLARRAFAQDASPPNLQRLWKDRAPGFLNDLIASNRAWLRELFLDGVLVNARLLDRHAVEAALSEEPMKYTANPAEIIRHLDTELWARHWESTARQSNSQCSVATFCN